MARLEVDRAFLRSPRGSLKISRTVRPGAALGPAGKARAGADPRPLLSRKMLFLPSDHWVSVSSHMDIAVTVFMAMQPFLTIPSVLGTLHVLLQDVLNSVIAALFLLVVSLFAIIIKTNKGTLAGGVSRNIVNEFQFLQCSDLNLLVLTFPAKKS
uniref:Uncharacterized protein n=1 Tax=Catharus ustulatus TaxID=91951 RepID=A0A8C3UUF6_CATUS